MDALTHIILDSFISSPLLLQDLPEAKSFDRSLLKLAETLPPLNLDQKLGHLYEDALKALIDASPALDCIADHVQIFDDTNRTLGELDFIVHDKDNNTDIHLELAVKFYLGVHKDGQWVFPGPNATDTLQRKINKMRTHQIPLAQTKEAKRLVQNRYGLTTLETRQLIYGCLFFPYMQDTVELPEFVNRKARRGRWLYAGQGAGFFEKMDMVYVIPKFLWPVPVSEATYPFYQDTSVAELISMARDRCVMFTVKGDKQVYFLVPDDWPGPM